MSATQTIGEEIKRVLEKYAHKRVIEHNKDLIIFETQIGDFMVYNIRNGLVCHFSTFRPVLTIHGGAGLVVKIEKDARGLRVETDAAIQPSQISASIVPVFRLINPTYIPPA